MVSLRSSFPFVDTFLQTVHDFRCCLFTAPHSQATASLRLWSVRHLWPAQTDGSDERPPAVSYAKSAAFHPVHNHESDTELSGIALVPCFAVDQSCKQCLIIYIPVGIICTLYLNLCLRRRCSRPELPESSPDTFWACPF